MLRDKKSHVEKRATITDRFITYSCLIDTEEKKVEHLRDFFSARFRFQNRSGSTADVDFFHWKKIKPYAPPVTDICIPEKKYGTCYIRYDESGIF